MIVATTGAGSAELWAGLANQKRSVLQFDKSRAPKGG
jgi:hypothetical protein